MLIRRRIAGLLAICAFALSYSEALTASACSMDMSQRSAMDMPMDMPMDGGDESHEGAPASQADCPLSMPGSSLNCVFSLVIAPAGEATPATTTAQRISFTIAEDHYKLLLAHSAFHPPKV
jgi:hypothetical protein